MRKLLIAAMTACALMAGAATAYADTTEVVLPGDPDWHSADTRAPGTGGQEEGPATPPAGTGSYELRTPVAPGPNPGAAKVQYLTDDYDGTRLADIDGIGYSTYLETPGVAVVALNLRVDLTGDGQPDAYMVFEPYVNPTQGPVLTNTWQDWDAYAGGSARWWLNTGAAGCGQATPCTWTQILAAFPDATIEEGTACGPGAAPKSPCPGSLGLNQGSGNPGVVSNADALYVSVGGEKTTYDFELNPPMPSTKDDCKNGGWQNYGTTFRNQGDCVAFVATRGKNAPGK